MSFLGVVWRRITPPALLCYIPFLWIVFLTLWAYPTTMNCVIFHILLLYEVEWCYFSPSTPLWSEMMLFFTFHSSMKWNDVISPFLASRFYGLCYFRNTIPLWSGMMLFFTFHSSMKWNDVIFHLSLLYEVKWCYFSPFTPLWSEMMLFLLF